MDLGDHKDSRNNSNASECSDESPESHKDVSDIMVRTVAVTKEARNWPWKLVELVARDAAVQPTIDVNIPAGNIHFGHIKCWIPAPLRERKRPDL